MKTWQCPKCLDKTEAIAVEVKHRCTKDRNRYVQYVVIGHAK